MAKIRFFPYHATTNGNMVDGDLDSFPSVAFTYYANNLLDRSRWTQWKADSATTVFNFTFDLNSAARVITYCILCGTDVKSIMSSALLNVWHDDNAGFTSQTQIVTDQSINTEPHFISTFTAPAATERYWKIRISGGSGKPSIGSIYLGERIAATHNSALGFAAGQDYSSIKHTLSPSGRISSRMGQRPKNSWTIKYKLMTEAFRTNLQTVLMVTLGSHYPLFIQDDEGTLFFVRLFIKTYAPKRSNWQRYEYDLIIVQEDFIDFSDGDGIGLR